MEWFSKIVWTLTFCVLINIHETTNPTELNLTTHLLKQIKDDPEINQILLLVDDAKKVPVPHLIQNLPKAFPTWEISFRNATRRKANSLTLLQSFSNPRRLLFVVITSSSSDQVLASLSRPINFMTKLSGVKRRPKVLIIIEVKKMTSYENLFRFMWSKKFLDVTVLEHQHQELQTATNQHHFNPFNGSFVKKKYSLRSHLFPDKLLDLHGYTIKVGLFHYPPFVTFTRNSTGDIINIDGPDVRLMNSLSEDSNFKLSRALSNNTHWDKFSCRKEENSGFFKSLVYNDIQFIGVQGPTTYLCLRKVLEASTSIWPIHYVAVVPIMKLQNEDLSTQWKFYNLGSLLGLIIIIWLMTRLLRFDHENWNMHDIMRVVLGSSIPREPSVLAERIVLGAMLVSFFLNSTIIFTAFTIVNLQKESDLEIKTVDDLISSDLAPILIPSIHRYLTKYADKKLLCLLERTVHQSITDTECLQYLGQHKNVTCFLRGVVAKWLIHQQRDAHRKPAMRILKDRLFVLRKGYFMETASPYVKRFEETSLRLAEAGIESRWYKMFISKPKPDVVLANTLISDLVESNDQIRINIMFVLIFGYTFSLLAYIGEVAVYFYKKFFH